MFKFIFRTICWSFILGGWVLAALSLHVVRTPDKIGLIPKDRLGIDDTYVDARKWTISDVSNHAPLVRRVLEANKAELFTYLATPGNGDITAQLQGAVKNAPAESDDSESFGAKLKGLFSSSSNVNKAGFSLPSCPLDF